MTRILLLEKRINMILKQKGTVDIFGTDALKWQYVESLIKDLCQTYNYGWIRTPVILRTEEK